MKWYLALVALLVAAVLGYQVVEMERWTPSAETLSHTFRVSARAQLGVLHSGGRITGHRALLLQGHEITCDIGVNPCDTIFQGLREDEPIVATLVDVPDGRDGRWLAMEMVRTSNGQSFGNSPEHIVRAWKSHARSMMLISVIALIYFLLVFPAMASKRFRAAWWATLAPGTGPRVVKAA